MAESRVAERGESASPGAAPEDRYAGGPAVDQSVQVKERSVEPATAAEGDTRAGESTPENVGAGAGTAAWARSFAAVQTASGLAHLPDLLPAAYRSLYLQAHLPFTGPMHSVLVLPPVRLHFCFGALLAPMHLAVSAQVFLFGLKTSFLGNAWDPFAKAIAVVRLYLTDLSALRFRVARSLRALSPSQKCV